MSQTEVQTQPGTPTAVRRRLRDRESPTKTPGPASKKHRREKVPATPVIVRQEYEDSGDETETEDVLNAHSTHMKLRARMYRLADQVEVVHRRIESGEDSQPGVRKVIKRYINADILHKDNKKIINGRDLAVDSLCSDRMSRMLITQVGHQSSNAAKFKIIALGEALVNVKDTYYDEHLSDVLELQVSRTVGFMFDFMAAPSKPKKVRAERKPCKRSAKGELVTVQGKQTKDLDDGTDMSLMEHLHRIQTVYRKYLKEHGTDRINYYEFVVDPDCFANTVENCFYVSFLLKDAVFYLERANAESPPMLRKLTAGEKAAKQDMDQGGPPREKTQYANSMTYAKWRFLVQRYNITSAMLPPATKE
uniref:Non-structural maintenance of chromosomes element 4 n=1 Tax=Panagrellus redivivus TaxID=6233 RepID=A0A7E4V704_PANRE